MIRPSRTSLLETEDGMRGVAIRLLLSGATGALLTGCVPEHPDRSRYEYMYIHGVFQAPYTSFPVGIERSNWKCYDETIRKEFDCTFVRGGWNQYHYIYRERR
jgi:hypothetical protein